MEEISSISNVEHEYMGRKGQNYIRERWKGKIIMFACHM